MTAEVSAYDLATGRILRAMRLPDLDAIWINHDPETEGMVSGWFDPATHYVAGGEALPIPEAPGPWAVFDHAAGEWIDPRTVDDLAAELVAARADALRRLLAICERFERRFVTPLPAQQMKYARKEADARAYLDDPDPDLADYPWVAAEVGVTAPTAYEVAQVYVNLSGLWTTVAGIYEPIRITHQDMIEAATTIPAAKDVVGAFKAAMAAAGLTDP